MREKSAEFFEEARVLANARKYNGAASRLYYSLYHALVAEFKEKGYKAAQFSSKVDPNIPDYWPHEVVRHNSTLIGLSRVQARIVKDIYESRLPQIIVQFLSAQLCLVSTLKRFARFFGFWE